MIYFIIGYVIFLIIFAIFSYIAFYHLKRYGYKEGASSTMMAVYTITALAIIVITFILLTVSGFSFPDNIQF